MLSIYFGKPGSGKSTLAVSLARKNMRKGKTVYSNFPIKGAVLIDNHDLGKYSFSDSLVIIDEASIDFNNRKYTDKSYREWFDTLIYWLKMHRHYSCEIAIFSQDFEDMDITFRRLADRLYFVRKGILPWFTHYRRIAKTITIDENKQIIDGYQFAKPLPSIIFNPPNWRLFDSWECAPLPPFPSTTTPVKQS